MLVSLPVLDLLILLQKAEISQKSGPKGKAKQNPV